MPIVLQRILAILAITIATAWDPASAAAPPASADAAIRRVMEASAQAWSAGDLDTFMDSYEDSPDTIFIAADGVIHGKAAIRAMYASRFVDRRPGALGKLSVDVIEIRSLDPAHALLVGRFHLRPAEADQPEATGLFTLLFARHAGRWRIVCDHTS